MSLSMVLDILFPFFGELEQGFDVLRYDEQQGGEGPDEEGVDHGCTCHGASPLHILTSISD